MALSPSDISMPVHVHDLAELVHAWTPPSNVMNVLGLFGVVCLIYLAAWLLNKKPRIHTGEDTMTRDKDNKHFRNIRVRAIVADGITDFVEDAIDSGKLTKYEATDIYTKIGRTFGLSDLLGRQPKRKLSFGEIMYLKEKIIERNPGIKDRLKEHNNVVELPKKRVYGKAYL